MSRSSWRSTAVDHVFRAVADVQDRDAGGEVDQPVPVDVLHDRARGARGHDLMDRREPRRHGPRPASDPLLGPRPGDLGDDLALLWDVHRASPPPAASSSGGCRRLGHQVCRVQATRVRRLAERRVAQFGREAAYWRPEQGSSGVRFPSTKEGEAMADGRPGRCSSAASGSTRADGEHASPTSTPRPARSSPRSRKERARTRTAPSPPPRRPTRRVVRHAAEGALGDDAQARRRDRGRCATDLAHARGRGRRQADLVTCRQPTSPSSPTTCGSSRARRGCTRASPPASTRRGFTSMIRREPLGVTVASAPGTTR